jgi:hypothetical protein
MWSDEEQTSPSEDSTEDSAEVVESSPEQQQKIEGDKPPRKGLPNDERRRKRSAPSDRRTPAGFGDGIERAICANFIHLGPIAFPVQHRPGVAASRPIEVARRENAVLLCDRNHAGDCVWPDGTFALVEKESVEVDVISETSAEIAEIYIHLEGENGSGSYSSDNTSHGESAEEIAGQEPATGGGDENWDSPGITNEDR